MTTMKSPPTTHNKRRVRFLPRTKVYLVPMLDEMSDDEVAAVWRLEDEERQTQYEIAETIRAMRRAGGRLVEEGDNISTRGLEHLRSAAHLEQQKTNKGNVVDAVLEEQERQWSKSTEDAEKIASASSRASQWALDHALSLAAEDASHVRRESRKSSGDESKNPYQAMFEEVKDLQKDYECSSRLSLPACKKSCLKNTLACNVSDRKSFLYQLGKKLSTEPSLAKRLGEFPTGNLVDILGHAVSVSESNER